MPYRLDRQKLQWERGKNGVLHAHITLGKADHPLSYYSLDSAGDLQRRVEVIEKAELFDDASISTALALPITLGHPASGRYNGNAEGLQVGSALETARNDDGTLQLTAAIQDKRGIDLIQRANADGLPPEISPGYDIASLYPLSRLDALGQRGRTYNHAALLPPGVGRGGQDIPLIPRLDAADTWASDRRYFILSSERQDSASTAPLKEKAMTTQITLKNRTYSVEGDDAPGLADAIASLQTSTDTLKGEVTTATQRADSAEGDLEALRIQAEGDLETLRTQVTELTQERDQLKGEKTALEAQRNDAADVNGVEVKLRLDTIRLIEPALQQDDPDFRVDSALGVADLQRLYISKAKPDINLDDVTDAELSGMWKVLAPSAVPTPRVDHADQFRQEVDNRRNDAGYTNAAEKRRKDRQEQRRKNGMRSTGAIAE